MSKIDTGALARNVRRLAHLDIPGAGQVTVAGRHAYIGHIPNKEQLGTTIVDIADPYNPRVVATVTLDDPSSHSHKVRVVGDVMIVNHERNMTKIGRRAEQVPAARAALVAALGREPSASEMAAKLAISEADYREVEAARAKPYANGGFKVYDVSDPTKPKLIAYHKTGGIGVHRFAMDARYAYISTEMDGYIGNILVTYDIADPRRPQEVSRWWMPGSTSRAVKRRPGRASGTGCTTRYALATSSGRAAGTAVSVWSTAPTSQSRARLAPTIIIRRFPSRHIP